MMNTCGFVYLKAFVVFVLLPCTLWADPFPRPKALQPNVDFWVRVYGEWASDRIILTDRDNLDWVYHVIKLPVPDDKLDRRVHDRIVKEAKNEVADALKDLDRLRPRSEKNLGGLHLEIYRFLQDVSDANKYQGWDNIRAQVGQKDRFEAGYERAAYYDMEMRRRFRAAGFPEELIAIVFVESMFYPTSYSKAKARGLWQFIPSTAKFYMSVNDLVDERLDPIIATDSAIAYLREAKGRLGKWPLAIMSYNHGQAGVARAVNQVGSDDIVDIIRHYRSRSFGFASKNYYAEFLAAIEVYKNADHYFPEANRKNHWNYDLVTMPYSAYVDDLVAENAIAREWLFEHNPALTPKVRSGKEIIPAEYKLRVPAGEAGQFEKRLAKANKRQKKRAEEHIRARHKATGRQTLKSIANQYGIMAESLARRLGLPSITAKPKRGTVILLRSEDTHFTPIPLPMYRPESRAQSMQKKKGILDKNEKRQAEEEGEMLGGNEMDFSSFPFSHLPYLNPGAIRMG